MWVPRSTFHVYTLYIGVLDSSGIEFFYTSTPRQHDAGILNIGHAVTFSMIIPPNAADFTIFGLCPASCTNQVCTILVSKYNNYVLTTQYIYNINSVFYSSFQKKEFMSLQTCFTPI